MSISENKDDSFATASCFNPGNEKEAEAQQRGSTILPGGRKMSRIGPPPGTSEIGDGPDTRDEISRLVEMEAGNSIKYRTCTWQKGNACPWLPSCISSPTITVP